MLLTILVIATALSSDGSIIINMSEGETLSSPSRYARWCEKPKLVICSGSNLNIRDIVNAYHKLNQKLSEVVEDKCECSLTPGVIKFGVECFDTSNLYGVTYLNFNIETECLNGSLVQIKKNDHLVLTHEAGHSIGWMHSSRYGHLMFGDYNRAGWSMEGMK